ncbi:diaminopimelate epimerase DapF [Gottschalkia purinilytica]|uniref:Diaminopimelate epimerase n=1 Tax=Gottschalkia purinilytica TaxID=1503 RepID=A0A0L0WEV5_GOTPU|nr:diaminopimelate epimerase [Gottschalkia purinilytica]KNF10018.1 diaminopimelate epimerase DapF [Gottschalkia purinilytica]
MLNFEKLQGTGNDFIIFNAIKDKIPTYSDLAIKVCDRHFGIGADGMIIVDESDIADIKMIFYNADGSEAPMCGNGIRCFAKYVYDNKIITKTSFSVETLGGIMKPELVISNNEVTHVKVNMGSPIFSTTDFPINTTEKDFINKDLEIDGVKYKISSLMIGTIHTVIKVNNLEETEVERIGPLIEKHPLFPLKTNVNFFEIVDEENINLKTWERGAGLTLACGTGATATAIISSILYNTTKTVNIHIDGGTLKIEQTENDVYMTGPAKSICKGVYNF